MWTKNLFIRACSSRSWRLYLSISLSTLRHRKKQSVGGSANLLCKWHFDAASAAPAQYSWIQMPRSCSWERRFNPLMRRFTAAPTYKKFSHTWDPKLINMTRRCSKFEGRPNCCRWRQWRRLTAQRVVHIIILAADNTKINLIISNAIGPLLRLKCVLTLCVTGALWGPGWGLHPL